MDEEKIHEIIKDKVKEIAGLSARIGDGFDKEVIHKFRTTTKSLRSFLRFLRLHTHAPGLKMTKKFKRLYHISGAIRDAQLEIDTIAEKKLAVPVYLNKLHRVICNQETEWKNHYSKKVIHKLNRRLTSYKSGTLGAVEIASFFKLKMKGVAALSKIPSPDDNQVHSIRKLVKDILYVAKPAKKKWKEDDKQIHLPEKELDHIATVIGDYNNGSVMLRHMSSFSSKMMQPDEKIQVKKYCAAETKRLSARKKSILTIVRRLKF